LLLFLFLCGLGLGLNWGRVVENSSTGLMVGTPSSPFETKVEFLLDPEEDDEEELDEDEEEEVDPVEPKKSGIGKVKTLSRISSLRSPVGIANTKVFSAFSASASALAASKLLPEDEAEASAAGAGAGTGAEADEELEDDATELFSSPSL